MPDRKTITAIIVACMKVAFRNGFGRILEHEGCMDTVYHGFLREFDEDAAVARSTKGSHSIVL